MSQIPLYKSSESLDSPYFSYIKFFSHSFSIYFQRVFLDYISSPMKILQRFPFRIPILSHRSLILLLSTFRMGMSDYLTISKSLFISVFLNLCPSPLLFPYHKSAPHSYYLNQICKLSGKRQEDVQRKMCCSKMCKDGWTANSKIDNAGQIEGHVCQS